MLCVVLQLLQCVVSIVCMMLLVALAMTFRSSCVLFGDSCGACIILVSKKMARGSDKTPVVQAEV